MTESRFRPSLLRGLAAREAGNVARFGLVGLSATGVHAVVAYLLLWALDWPVLVVNTAAFLVAVGWSYVGHAYVTFGQRRVAARQFAAFFASAILVYLVLSVTIIASQALGFSEELSLMIAIVLAAAASFLINRLAVFSRLRPL